MPITQKWEEEQSQGVLNPCPPQVVTQLKVHREILRRTVEFLQSAQHECARAKAMGAQQDLEDYRQRLDDVADDLSTFIAEHDLSSLATPAETPDSVPDGR